MGKVPADWRADLSRSRGVSPDAEAGTIALTRRITVPHCGQIVETTEALTQAFNTDNCAGVQIGSATADPFTTNIGQRHCPKLPLRYLVGLFAARYHHIHDACNSRTGRPASCQPCR